MADTKLNEVRGAKHFYVGEFGADSELPGFKFVYPQVDSNLSCGEADAVFGLDEAGKSVLITAFNQKVKQNMSTKIRNAHAPGPISVELKTKALEELKVKFPDGFLNTVEDAHTYKPGEREESFDKKITGITEKLQAGTIDRDEAINMLLAAQAKKKQKAKK